MKKININKSRLEKLYLNKMLSSYKIAKIYKCDPTVIQKRLREYKILLIHKKRKVIISKRELYSLYIVKRLSSYKIAEFYDCSSSTIFRYLKLYKISIRKLKRIYLTKKELNKLYTKNKFPLSKIARIYNCSPTGIFKKMKEYNIKRRDAYESNRRYPRQRFSGDFKEKAYLIGFRLGDLHAFLSSKETVILKSNTTTLVQVELIQNLFKKYGHVYVKGDKGTYYTECFLDKSFRFLVKKEDDIPSWILKNNNLFFAFLGGYTDAEGNIGIYSNMARYRVGSYDKKLLSLVNKRLNKLGIISKYRLETKKGIYENRGYNGDFWRVTVSEKSSLLCLFSKLKHFIKHGKRYNDLLNAENNIIERNNKFNKISNS
ncbi:hypothetical protein J4449_03970 [Candidatus Woesearchaeota archaeon]|nr:hypothetical protein [Candidatus Woesearchaeota archaeon]